MNNFNLQTKCTFYIATQTAAWGTFILYLFLGTTPSLQEGEGGRAGTSETVEARSSTLNNSPPHLLLLRPPAPAGPDVATSDVCGLPWDVQQGVGGQAGAHQQEGVHTLQGESCCITELSRVRLHNWTQICFETLHNR